MDDAIKIEAAKIFGLQLYINRSYIKKKHINM
jgi:hypothetical protein